MSRPLIIGIDASRSLRARRTGTERYSLEIIQHLLALPQAAQHRWQLYTDSPPPSGLFPTRTPGAAEENVACHVLHAPRLWTHTALRRQLLTQPPDVVFVPAHVLPWPTWGLPPSVVTIHDLGYRHFPESHGAIQRRYLAWGTRWSARSAARVIAISQATAQDLAHFDAIDPAKMRVIYEAATPSQPSDRPLLADVAKLPAYALFVSTIQPRKNVARLIQAFAFLVKNKSISWDLVLGGGKGWLSDSLFSLAGELGVADRVHFLGYVADADLPGLYTHARLFCYPSLFEGFGLPILEAQSYGVPVMTSNNSALPEVAGDAAILVDPNDINAIADAMLRLSQDEELRQRLIAAGYENVKRFSWDKAARETLAVLEDAAVGSRNPG